MSAYVIYEVATNQIRFIENRYDDVPVLSNEYAYFESPDENLSIDQYWIHDGVLKIRERQPSIFYEWDGENWVRNETMYYNSQAEIVRGKRNQLLSESDWVLNSDIQVNKDEWLVYRQALRDVPTQQNFPYDIEWPIKPA